MLQRAVFPPRPRLFLFSLKVTLFSFWLCFLLLKIFNFLVYFSLESDQRWQETFLIVNYLFSIKIPLSLPESFIFVGPKLSENSLNSLFVLGIYIIYSKVKLYHLILPKNKILKFRFCFLIFLGSR